MPYFLLTCLIQYSISGCAYGLSKFLCPYLKFLVGVLNVHDDIVNDVFRDSCTDLSGLLIFTIFLLITRDGASRARPRFHDTVASVQSYCHGAYFCS